MQRGSRDTVAQNTKLKTSIKGTRGSPGGCVLYSSIVALRPNDEARVAPPLQTGSRDFKHGQVAATPPPPLTGFATVHAIFSAVTTEGRSLGRTAT